CLAPRSPGHPGASPNWAPHEPSTPPAPPAPGLGDGALARTTWLLLSRCSSDVAVTVTSLRGRTGGEGRGAESARRGRRSAWWGWFGASGTGGRLGTPR